mgnify:CR=1 FL=1
MSDEETKRNANGLDTVFMKGVFERMKELLHMEVLDEETSRMFERIVIVRISTKHINLWMRLLEMKRREMSELAGLIGLE